MSTLKVDTIQHSGGTTGMTIDSSGRILQPAKPAFRARIAGSGSAQGKTGTLIFETEDFDIGGNYNLSTGIFTCPISGIYTFTFNALSAGSNTGSANVSNDTPWGDFYKNGSILTGTRFYAYVNGGSFHATFNATTILQLSASDEIKVVIGAEYVYADTNAQYDPCFAGFLVS